MIDFVVVRDKDLNKIKIIDNFVSVIWHRKYYGVGDFELYLRATDDVMPYLKIGNFVTRSDITNNPKVGVIRSVKMTTDPKNGKMVTVSGYFAEILLSYRLLYFYFSGEDSYFSFPAGTRISYIIGDIVEKIFTGGEYLDPNRNIPLINWVEEAASYDDVTDNHIVLYYENVLTYILELAKTYKMGLTLDYHTRAGITGLRFLIKKGEDKSATVIFSPMLDNLINLEYSVDDAPEKTTAYLKSVNYPSIVRAVNKNNTVFTGLERKEIYIETQTRLRYTANELLRYFPGGEFDQPGDPAASTYYYTTTTPIKIIAEVKYMGDPGTDPVWQPEDEYFIPLLISDGYPILTNYIRSETFSCELDLTRGPYYLGTDFDLGDIVTVKDKTIPVSKAVRLTEITEVEDASGYTVHGVFSADEV